MTQISSFLSHNYALYPNGTIISDTKLMTPAQKRRYLDVINYWTNLNSSNLEIGSSEGIIYLPRIQSLLLPHEVIITESSKVIDQQDIDLTYQDWQNETNKVGKRVLRNTQQDRSLARIVLGDSGLVALIEGKLNFGRHLQGTEKCLGYKEVYREE